MDRSQRRTGEAPAAQRGCIRDEAELAACLCYVWGNPVKHGLVERAVDWPYSSVHGEVRSGRLPGERVWPGSAVWRRRVGETHRGGTVEM